MMTEKQADRIIALLERIAESVERPTILSGTTIHLPLGCEYSALGELAHCGPTSQAVTGSPA